MPAGAAVCPQVEQPAQRHRPLPLNRHRQTHKIDSEMKNKIERSNQHGKFTPAEIRERVAESKRYWSSPEGIAEKRKLNARRAAAKKKPCIAPELLKRGTKPMLVTSSVGTARLRLLNKVSRF